MLEKSITEELKKEFKRRLQDETLSRVLTCIDLLSEEQVWDRPNEHSNSVANLVLHLNGNIRQYILSGIGGREDTRDRDHEFASSKTHSRAELKRIISNTVSEAVEVVEEVRPDMLTRIKPVQCFQESVLSIMIHVVEHASYHCGQISLLTKLMVNMDLGFYAGLSLDQTGGNI